MSALRRIFTHATRNPDATEVCDGDDEDFYDQTYGDVDVDNDLYPSSMCCNGAGNCGLDCNDGQAATFPGAPEICNGLDDDCDGVINERVCVDECALGTDDCEASANCADTVDGFTCTCPPDVGGTGHGAAGCGGTHFTDLGGGLVRDNRTGLVWQQAVETGSYPLPGTYTQAEAVAYCTSLTLGGDGWRLPLKDELLSIVDTRWFAPNATIDPGYFPSAPPDGFWSSSSVTGSSSIGWYVFFYVGELRPGISDFRLRARCVR